MMKRSILAVTLLVFSGWSLAAGTPSEDDLGRRNSRINRYCTSLVQNSHGYAKQPAYERARQDRLHAQEIEDCYSKFSLQSEGAAAGS